MKGESGDYGEAAQRSGASATIAPQVTLIHTARPSIAKRRLGDGR